MIAPLSRLFIDNGSFGNCMSCLTTEELAISCLVSKSWQSFMDSPSGQFLWKNASLREGVPLVEGENRNYKADFKFLRPITIGGKIIARYLGEIVGEIPSIRQSHFLQLKYSVDYFEPTRLKRETHEVIVDPAALKITVSPDRPLTLDKSGSLVEIPNAEWDKIVPKELIVLFSFKNLRMLSKYPLKGQEKGPVIEPRSMAEIFERCKPPPDQNRILVMRREIVARNTPFNGDEGQNTQIKSRRWEVATVRQRGLYNVVKILKTGTCPDNINPWTFARSAERIEMAASRIANVDIGGFVPGSGIIVNINSGLSEERIGVVPVRYAEVLGH